VQSAVLRVTTQSPGKPGKVREFQSGQGKVRKNGKTQGKVRGSEINQVCFFKL